MFEEILKDYPEGIVKKIEFKSDDVPNYIEWFLELEKKSKEHPLPLD